MHRVLFLAVVLVAVSADSDEDKKKCLKLSHAETIKCCKTEFPIPNIDPEDLKECFDIPFDPHACDHEMCIAKKRGTVADDGTIKRDVLEKMITEDFKSAPSLAAAIKDNCVNGDVSHYGPPDACELQKLKFCIHVQAVNDCKEWKDDGSCSGIKDLVQQCAKMMS